MLMRLLCKVDYIGRNQVKLAKNQQILCLNIHSISLHLQISEFIVENIDTDVEASPVGEEEEEEKEEVAEEEAEDNEEQDSETSNGLKYGGED